MFIKSIATLAIPMENTQLKRDNHQWMGILGPQIRAVEGDTLVVHFLNKSDKPLSIHPHGMHYDEKNEGADMKGPGNFFTYRWTVNNETAPWTY